MRSQLTITTLLFFIIFTLVLVTAILAERPPTPTPTFIHSPYLTRFSERDPWISRVVVFNRVFLKQRRRFESFCRWAWDLLVVRAEVKAFREDIFHLRLLEDTVFLSADDVRQFSAVGLELQRRSARDPDDDDDDDIQDTLRIVETELSARIPSERRLVIEYLRRKLLNHEEPI